MKTLPLLFLAGCLATPGAPQDAFEGSDSGLLVDGDGELGADGGSTSDPDAADLPDDWPGTYSITWTLVGGDCAEAAIAADTLILTEGPPGLASFENDCGAPDTAQTMNEETLAVDPLLALYACDGQTYEELGAFTIVEDDDELLATVSATRRNLATTALCTATYEMEGTR